MPEDTINGEHKRTSVIEINENAAKQAKIATEHLLIELRCSGATKSVRDIVIKDIIKKLLNEI